MLFHCIVHVLISNIAILTLTIKLYSNLTHLITLVDILQKLIMLQSFPWLLFYFSLVLVGYYVIFMIGNRIDYEKCLHPVKHTLTVLFSLHLFIKKV